MRRLGLLLVLFIFPLSLQTAEVPVQKTPGNLYLLNISYKGPQDNAWNFLPRGFEQVLREQGKPLYRHMYTHAVLDEEATHDAVMDGLAWLCKHATKDDLVFVYIACHGLCNNGESVFMVQDGEVRPQEVKQELAKLPCQAIVVNDACQSGNWALDRPDEDDPMPPNVSALCCCLPTQNSSYEFDITLFEALYGRADFNKDGVIDLDEVIKYCGLRIKEVQGGRLTPVLHKAKSLKGALPLTKVAPDLVGVVHNGEMWSGILEKQSLDGDLYHVRIIAWDIPTGAKPTKAVTRDYLCLPEDGPALMVEQDGQWYTARLLERKGKDYKIRYLGEKQGEEVVKAERVRHVFAGKPGEKFPLGANSEEGNGNENPESPPSR